MTKVLTVLLAYWKAKRLKFSSREALEAHQRAQLAKFLPWMAQKSAYFQAATAALDKPAVAVLENWPMMDKAVMMEFFDTMNTARLPLSAIMQVAQEAEATRDFQGTVRGYTVGLSSGTSSMRGAFVVSNAEKSQWAGVMLARMLPAGLFKGERVALFLRADSGLYQTVKSRWLTFEFFDLMGDFAENAQRLSAYNPTIVVAPAQVLRQLALDVHDRGLALSPKRVISVAEVLEPQDQEIIETVFGSVHQVYQATEGFLASTCEHGTLHLNEEYVHIEPEWVDEAQTRFIPVITDFTRKTQPIVRYRLNDVLVAKKDPCPCGRVTRAIERIEGRCDDLLLLPGRNGRLIPVFADALHRVMSNVLPLDADYRLAQPGRIRLKLSAQVPQEAFPKIRLEVEDALRAMSIAVGQLQWEFSSEVPPFTPSVKRRRITRQYNPA